MLIGKYFGPHICARCLHRQSGLFRWEYGRSFSQTTHLPQQAQQAVKEEETERKDEGSQKSHAGGRMSERLSQMTEESIGHGGRGAKKTVEDAGFSEELKRKLEARLEDSKFKSENPAAFAELSMPSSAGRGTRDVAAAQPWTGSETINDAALRMLNDAHKPLRGTGPPKIPQPHAPSMSVDMRMKKAVKKSRGEQLASARDRMSVYALSQDPTLSEKEREQMRKALKERFTPGARSMPGSVQGLAALANERIEDAIGRGQFKNIARGKGVNTERDHNADSPWIDTTEYFMNKMIKKQEIVPLWIEKQQELVREAARFRGRLRHDWKRHAARVISSLGGSLEQQVKRAEAYAVAEAALNPRVSKREALSEIDEEGRLSQVTITEATIASSKETQTDIKITVSEDLAADAPNLSELPSDSISNGASANLPDSSSTETNSSENTAPIPPDPTSWETNSSDPLSPSPGASTPPTPLRLTPFRDDDWLKLESSYHTLAIRSLNNLTRSYNLQAPDLAKKPYFSLDRELRSCFADIAPQLPGEIRERARRPEKIRVELIGHRPGGVLEKFSIDKKVKVYDSQRRNYGFKDFWNDLWGGEAKA